MVEFMRFAAWQKLPMKIVLRWFELLGMNRTCYNLEIHVLNFLHHELLNQKNSQKLKRAHRCSIYYKQKNQIYHKVADELSKELHSSKLKLDSLQVHVSVL